MKFFDSKAGALITDEEMCSKYGTHEALPVLGVYELSLQPDYDPVSFELLEDGTYYPVQSYDDKVGQAKAALIAAGLSPEQADTALA
jgi:hypothetical protein